MSIKSFIINPGSTSTKIGVFKDETLLFEETIRHSAEEIGRFISVADQKDFRKAVISDLMREKNFPMDSLDVIVGRGGLLKPIPGGTYAITDDLLQDLIIGQQGVHASNLGGILAKELAEPLGIPSYIVDPVSVDEMIPAARLSGIPELPRISLFHALNQKAVAKRYAREQNVPYEDLNLIVVHLGGGVSVGAHEKGRVIDVFNALDGDGAFSPERAGSVPSGALMEMCFSGRYTKEEIRARLVGHGGFQAYLGTNDMQEVNRMCDEYKNPDAILLRDAFFLQVAKDIGAMGCVLKGRVDQILVTGGISHSQTVINALKERTGFIAPATVYPGEDELLALAQGAIRVLTGREEVKFYNQASAHTGKTFFRSVFP